MTFSVPAIAALASLVGTVVGGLIAHFSSMHEHRVRVHDERRRYRVKQLERLDASLETINKHASTLLSQTTNLYATGKPFDAKALSEARLVESEFLIEVYLQDSLSTFNKMKGELYCFMRFVAEVAVAETKAVQDESGQLFTDVLESCSRLQSHLMVIRKQIVATARELESN